MTSFPPPGGYGSGGYGPGGYGPGGPVGPGGYGGGPYGQPQQSTPWQQPQQPPGYGAPYGMPPAGPSGVTAIIAGVLAALAGARALFSALGSFIGTAGLVSLGSDVSGYLPGWYSPIMIVIGLFDLAAAALLISGAIMMFLRKRISPLLVTIGSGLMIAEVIVSIIVVQAVLSDLGPYGGAYVGTSIVVSLLGCAWLIAIIVLAQLRSTKNYCTR